MLGGVARSRIEVDIDGDAKGLQTELRKADAGIKGFGSKVSASGLVAAAAFAGATAAVFEFGSTALEEGDRAADAITRLEDQLGPLSDSLIDTADDFAKLGASRQDILELEATFADMATAVGISDDAIALLADDVASTASALALITDLDPETIVGLIGKGAGGSIKALKELGVELDEESVLRRAMTDTGKASADMLTEGEIAAARYAELLDELAPRLEDVKDGTGDVEQKTAELEARWETLQGLVGERLDPILTDFVGSLLLGVEAFIGLQEGTHEWNDSIQELFTPLAILNDLVTGVTGNLLDMTRALGGTGSLGSTAAQVRAGAGGGGSTRGGGGDGGVNLYVTPRDSADTERSVVNALRDYERRNGRDL